MRKALRWLLSLVVLIGTVSAAGCGTAAARTSRRRSRRAGTDIKDRILAIPGMSLIEEKPYAGYRYFVLNYTQPVDHRHPSKGTFKQRITLLHKDTNRPTVFFTSGYNVSTNAAPQRADADHRRQPGLAGVPLLHPVPARPGRLVQARHLAGRQRPAPHLHRAEEDLRQELAHHRRLQGRHDRHLLRALLPARHGRRRRVRRAQRRGQQGGLGLRPVLREGRHQGVPRPAERRAARGAGAPRAAGGQVPGVRPTRAATPSTTVGSLDKAYEAVVLDYVWAFWQYSLLADCATIPAAATATDQEICDTHRRDLRLLRLHRPGPGAVHAVLLPGGHRAGLARHQAAAPGRPEPLRLPAAAQLRAARHPDDVQAVGDAGRGQLGAAQRPPDDVRLRAERPVGRRAVPARQGRRDSYVYTAPGANHGANVAGLVGGQKAQGHRRDPRSGRASPRPPRPAGRRRRRSRWRSSTRSSTSGTSSERGEPHVPRGP